MRAVAAGNVLVCHALIGSRWTPGWILPLLDGGIGVQLFFVLSGFLLSLPFMRARARGARVELGAYAIRRMLRILPAYYVNLFLCLLFLWPEGLTSTMGVATVLAHLTLTFAMSEAMIRAVSPVFWTLCVEEQFYLLLPFIAPLFSSRRGLVILTMTLPLANILGWSWDKAIGARGVALTASMPYHWTAFVLGILVGVLFHRHGAGDGRAPRAGRRAAPIAMLAGLAAVYAAKPLCGEGIACIQVWAAGWALVLASALWGPQWLGSALRLKPVRALGLMTFSVYLWHILVAERVVALSDPPTDAIETFVRIALVFLFTLPFAAGSYLLIERPFMELRRRLETRRQTV